MIYSRIVLVYFAYVYIYTCDERFLRVKCRREESRLKTFARPEAALRSSRCLLPPTGLLGARLRCDCVFSKATNSCRSREALAEGAAGFSLFCGRARYVVCRCRLFFLHLCTTHTQTLPFARDDRLGRCFAAAEQDDEHRPYKLWLHTLGTPQAEVYMKYVLGCVVAQYREDNDTG